MATLAGGWPMICPRCESKTKVTHSRDGGEVTRRRVCTSCGHRFKTRERSEESQLGLDAKFRRMARDLIEQAEAITSTRK